MAPEPQLTPPAGDPGAGAESGAAAAPAAGNRAEATEYVVLRQGDDNKAMFIVVGEPVKASSGRAAVSKVVDGLPEDDPLALGKFRAVPSRSWREFVSEDETPPPKRVVREVE